MAIQRETTKPRLSSVQVEPTAAESKDSGDNPVITGEEKAKGGRPRRAPDVGLWTIRGVDMETRTAIEKAAQHSGKTIGQYVNEELRQYAQEQLKKGHQPPMRQQDIRTELDDIKGLITQLADRLPAQEKRGFFQRLFG
jgi:uncharacterized protein (DUF1778 family)